MMRFFKSGQQRGRAAFGGWLALLMVLAIPAFAAENSRPDWQNPARSAQAESLQTSPDAVVPGMVNYLQGNVFLGGQRLPSASAGSAIVRPGEILSTGEGKAEMLLTPGVFFRLGDQSAVKMVSPGLTWTAVDLEKGQAIIEVDQISPENNLQVYSGGVGAQLLKTGIYKLNAATSTVLVFKGEAAVRKAGTNWVVVKSGHEYALHAEAGVKPQKFDPAAAEGNLYAWSSLRSQYIAQANPEMVAPYGGFYPGWGFGPAWGPYSWGYGYYGSPFWRPFGWGAWGRPYFGGSVFIPYHGGHRYYHSPRRR